MEQALIYCVFLSVILVAIKKSSVALAILLNINLFRAIPYVDYKYPYYGYYNENDLLLGAILPAICFLIILIKIFWKKDKINYKVDIIDVFMLFLSLIMIISVIYSPNFSKSIYYTGIFIILGCPFYFVTKLLFLNSNNIKKQFFEFVYGILFFAFIFSLISLYLHSIAKYPYARMTFPGVFPIPFCLFLCTATIFIIIYYIKPNFKGAINKKAKILFSLPVFAIIFFSIIKSNTRGPVFAMVLASLIVLGMFFKIKLNIKIILAFIVTSFSGLIVLVTAFDINKIAMRFIDLVPEKGNSLSPRLLAYADSIKLLIQRPWGISVGTFEDFYSNQADSAGSSYAHNLFMELISSFGLIGLLISFFIIYICLYEYNFIIKNQKKIFSDYLFFTSIVLVTFYFFETQFSFTLSTHKGWYFALASYSVFKFKFLKSKHIEN
ncbi:O-antigen ligase family protein [Polaribacter vadi]|uniref:O-antigen ligase family protein n=1 Tax=Polaribacter vadi TaxID=1774273 RepID=UPI0030EDC3EE|tara:strand:- start:14282 stop:15592 length:1311 start_codon:yes stop_codon:yes gene_type:complete